jgi:hypothetical protein
MVDWVRGRRHGKFRGGIIHIARTGSTEPETPRSVRRAGANQTIPNVAR